MALKLPKSFVDSYRNIEPQWGPLGWITYRRTYSRKDGDKYETFVDTIERAVNGDLRRMELAGDPRPKREKLAEAKELFDYLFNFSLMLAGRGYWMSGTEFEEMRGSAALNNCYFTSAEPYKGQVSYPFTFMFDMLMLGGGVGLGVGKESIDKIPAVKRDVKLRIICDPKHKDMESKTDNLVLTDKRLWRPTELRNKYIRVPDTREGWRDTLGELIDAHFGSDVDELIVDISDIRPSGTPIKGFGGVASGPMPLVVMLFSVNEILNKRVGGRLTSVDCLDIANLVGKCVVSGNVRRSAEIVIGNHDDVLFVTAKMDEEALKSHRWASNNSVFIDENTNYEALAEAIIHNGEPGIVNLDVARNYGRLVDGRQEGIDGRVKGVNPCGEITLEDYENCNLIEFVPFVVRKNADKGHTFERALELAARYTYRVTFAPHHVEATQEVVERNRRTGISITGFVDYLLDKYGVTSPVKSYKKGKHVFHEEIAREVDGWYRHAKKANAEYAELLGTNPSIKITTVKPSGSVSNLPGVSAGMHHPYAEYYIRRIRFQENDPLVEPLRLAGYKVEKDIYTPNTVVVEFPSAASVAGKEGFRVASDLTIEEQFAIQHFLQTYWADNAVSATLTFKEDERHKIADLLRTYAPMFKSTSLLPYSGHGYEQAPFEPITKEQYEEALRNITMSPQQAFEAFGGDGEESMLDMEECVGGFCPVR